MKRHVVTYVIINNCDSITWKTAFLCRSSFHQSFKHVIDCMFYLCVSSTSVIIPGTHFQPLNINFENEYFRKLELRVYSIKL